MAEEIGTHGTSSSSFAATEGDSRGVSTPSGREMTVTAAPANLPPAKSILTLSLSPRLGRAFLCVFCVPRPTAASVNIRQKLTLETKPRSRSEIFCPRVNIADLDRECSPAVSQDSSIRVCFVFTWSHPKIKSLNSCALFLDIQSIMKESHTVLHSSAKHELFVSGNLSFIRQRPIKSYRFFEAILPQDCIIQISND